MLDSNEIKEHQEYLKELKEKRDKARRKLNGIEELIRVTENYFQDNCPHNKVKDNDYLGTVTCEICGKFIYDYDFEEMKELS